MNVPKTLMYLAIGLVLILSVGYMKPLMSYLENQFGDLGMMIGMVFLFGSIYLGGKILLKIIK